MKNESKKVNRTCELKNKLIDFIYFLKSFFTLSHNIKLFY